MLNTLRAGFFATPRTASKNDYLGMNIKFAQDYINRNGERILGLFSAYQRIEFMLFAQLFFPEVRKIGFEKANKILKTKTLGFLTKEYNKAYPGDELNLLEDIKVVNMQRNSFMHSFWILIALFGEDKEGMKKCDSFFNQFEENASKLESKIYSADWDREKQAE